MTFGFQTYSMGRRQAVKPPGFDPGMRRFESYRPREH